MFLDYDAVQKYHGFEPIFSHRKMCTWIEQVHPSPLLAAGQQNGGWEKIRQAKKHKGLQQKCSGVPRNAVHISHPAAAKNAADDRKTANAHSPSPASVDVITIIVSSSRAVTVQKTPRALWRRSIRRGVREERKAGKQRSLTRPHSYLPSNPIP